MVVKRPFSLLLKLALALAVIFSFDLIRSDQEPVLAVDQDIHSITVDTVLQEDGSAKITEYWDITTHEGTEIYKPLVLTDAQELSDYQVSMDGQPFSPQKSWDVDASFNAKAYQFGRNENSELNWGISDYGRHTYQVSYRISNFVMQTTTNQMIYWRFISDNLADSPESIRMTIASEKEDFNLENNRVWGFGFRGQVHIEDGKVVAESKESLPSSGSGILLVRIPQGTYPTQWTSDKAFDDYVKEAFEGSDYNWEDYDSNAAVEDITSMPGEGMPKLIKWGLIGLGGLGVVGILAGEFQYIKSKRALKKWYPSIERRSQELDGQYYRDLPADNIYSDYFILDQLAIDDLDSNYLTGTILYLVKEGGLKLGGETGLFKDNHYFMVNSAYQAPDLDPIKDWWRIFNEVADDKGQFSEKDFKKYCQSRTDRLKGVSISYRSYSKNYLLAGDFIQNKTYAKAKEDQDQRYLADSQVTYPFTDKGHQLRDNWVKFYNYLKDFSLLNERGAQEVALWDRLLIYAAVLGIAAEVAKEFANLYPDFEKQSVYTGTGDINFWQYYYIANIMNRSYTQSIAPEMTSAMSSGGGGFSSFGGGGGAFGGGGGGGAR
ncbi:MULTISPECIES: DUF2207 family protein [Aerococcus]|uniref:DUF2207 family protein n=1 Tax=Aerococcus TaxID=1375 RepID=UPI000DCEF152|nr:MULTISPECIES: DUF2207 domain-containing protein [Aerococcus]MDK6689505.1 DUF2207 domain-containing protein [Aerococcus urinae]MDK8132896.1 DUF2207 domain-containing protein [Aerococcus urinae]MDK8483925.1 DUF2207 domain-containing protein [Aerococcus urinae]MDL5178850.1 DUF2207 domain-containing protein [Aerococcus tenax]MDL5207805.1 DUF2207 domain-containing protein [Aerococcus tenax]